MTSKGKFILWTVAGLLTWGAVSLIRKAKAAQELRWGVQKIQLYQFAANSNLKIKISLWFTNIESAALTVQNIFFDLFLNFGTEENPTLHRIATLNTDNQEFTIKGNSTEYKDFYINVPWANLGVATAVILLNSIKNGHLDLPDQVILDGRIKCYGFNIKVKEVYPIEITQDTTATPVTEGGETE